MSPLEHDPIEIPEETPLEPSTGASGPLLSLSDDEKLLGLSLHPDALRPAPAPRRFALIAVAGFVLICLAGIARVALEHAAPPPPGVIEPTAARGRSLVQDLDTSVARYEYERARAIR